MLDKIHDGVLFNNKKITPRIFSMLFGKIEIQDNQFHQLLRILSKSCSLMNQNDPNLVGGFFLSEEFFQQFVGLGKIIDELWMLKRRIPGQLQEWKLKQRQIFLFRSKLLQFLEKSFGREWVQEFNERAKSQSDQRAHLHG